MFAIRLFDLKNGALTHKDMGEQKPLTKIQGFTSVARLVTKHDEIDLQEACTPIASAANTLRYVQLLVLVVPNCFEERIRSLD